MSKKTTQNFIAMVTLLFSLVPLTSSAQSWANGEGGVFNIPPKEYNEEYHGYGSFNNVIYNKIDLQTGETMRINNPSDNKAPLYNGLGELIDQAWDSPIGRDHGNIDSSTGYVVRDGGIIAGSIAQVKVGNTTHTMVYAWSVNTQNSGRRSGWIKLEHVTPNYSKDGIRDILEDTKTARMAILQAGGVNNRTYDEYKIIKAELPSPISDYYVVPNRAANKTAGQAKFYYSTEEPDGFYISGMKNIPETGDQRFGVAVNNLPIDAKFYRDRSEPIVEKNIYPASSSTPDNHKLRFAWGYSLTSAGERIYSFINERTLQATGNNDVTNQGGNDDDDDDDSGDSSCDWSKIANENQVMNFSGSKTIRYGANGVYITKVVNGGTRCSNAVFGDPIRGVLKTCEECKDDNNNNPNPNPSPTTGNIAPDGTASQSSTTHGGSASRAIDKNTSGVFTQNSVTHTNNESRPHWQVEWNDVYEITEIKIYNRTDCCTDRLSDFRVFVIDDITGDVNFRQDYTGISGSSLTINTGGVKGTRVKIRLNGSNVLSLAEVEVKGTRSSNAFSLFASISAVTAASEALVLYPNPTENNEIKIRFQDGNLKTIFVTNLAGQTVISKQTSDEHVVLNLLSLEKGMYFVRIVHQDGSTDQRSFLKNN